MKRHLRNNRHELSDWEKENLWHAIEAETRGSGRPRRTFRPALGLAAAAALLVVAGAWWIGTSDPQRGFIGQDPGVVVLPPEMKVDQVEDRDPALDLRNTREMEAKSRLQEVLSDSEVAGEPALDLAEEITEVAVGREKSAQPKAETVAESPPAPAARAAALASPPPVRSAAVAPVSGVIRGRVVDRKTGQPLAHASVLIRGTARAAATDSTGQFEFTGLEPGRQVELQVLLLNYAPATSLVSVPGSGAAQLEILLETKIAGKPSGTDVADLEYRRQVERAAAEREARSPEIQQNALDAVEEALGKKAGVVSRAGQLYVRGGRSGEMKMLTDSDVPMPATVPPSYTGPGSVTGGSKPPNGEKFELMYFEHTGVNPFIATEDDSLSTFAVDVDNASWTLARSYLRRGQLPPKEAIRVEEFVNAFDAGWPSTKKEVFRIHSDGAESRFGQGYRLLRIGVVGKTIDEAHRKPANLVFVIDISGSMNRENRLGLVKQSLHVLLDELREGDRVGLVVYGSRGEIRLEPTDIEHRETIERAIDALGPGGSTNAFEGLDLAYAMARRTYEAGKVNRLILCSDGVANNGASTEAEEMLAKIRRSSDEGITLSTIGFGMGNYNDVLMEKLADQGDGNYYYVDEMKEAERVFRENLTGLLQTIAREVKVQVEFDKDLVSRWRLLGYENRDVADRDFRNDAVDAGEVGSGHQVTALYEIKLASRPAQAENRRFVDEDDREMPTARRAPLQLGVVRLRHEAPAHETAHAGEVKEIESPILLESVAGDFAAGSVWLRTQAVVAEFAEILRGSYWAKESRLADLVATADGLAAEMAGDPQVKELAELIRLAADIEAGQEAGDDEQRLPSSVEPLEKEGAHR